MRLMQRSCSSSSISPIGRNASYDKQFPPQSAFAIMPSSSSSSAELSPPSSPQTPSSPSKSKNRGNRQQHTKSNKTFSKSQQRAIALVLLFFFLCMYLIFIQLQLTTTTKFSHRYEQKTPIEGVSSFWEGATTMILGSAAKPAYEVENDKRMIDAAALVTRRAEERRIRTRPPKQGSTGGTRAAKINSGDKKTERYEYAWLDETRKFMPRHYVSGTELLKPGRRLEVDGVKNKTKTNADQKKTKATATATTKTLSTLSTTQKKLPQFPPASIEQLCGAHATAASKHHPNSYLAPHALNSKSRVLITGILNPLGFHLALALHYKCGVQSMIGIDNMLPNTMPNRLEYQKRIAILTREIPGLSHPGQQSILLPFSGVDPCVSPAEAMRGEREGQKRITLASTGELNLQSTYQFTHIVHLASAFPNSYQDDTALVDRLANMDGTAYYTSPASDGSGGRMPPFFQIRQSGIGMEQILASVAENKTVRDEKISTNPQIVFASSRAVMDKNESRDDFFGASKNIEEVLANTYYNNFGVYSTGLRFPTIYGPWGMRGSIDYDLAQEAVRNWKTNSTGVDGLYRKMLNHTRLLNRAEEVHELLFVDDAVDALIAAMQYREADSLPMTFNIGSVAKSSLDFFAKALTALVPNGTEIADVHTSIQNNSKLSEAPVTQLLHWEPSTSLVNGTTKLLAWHLDKNMPFGPSILDKKKNDGAGNTCCRESGSDLLYRKGLATCPTDDKLCLRGMPVYPCMSECADTRSCTPSRFDDVASVIKDQTNGCDVVLYAFDFGLKVERIGSKVTRPSKLRFSETVCSIFFVAQESPLVRNTVTNVSVDEIKHFGVPTKTEKLPLSEGDIEERKKKLNGVIQLNGWDLTWISISAAFPLKSMEENLLKLSPGRLFAPSVKYAIFVGEQFRHSLDSEDALFFIDQMYRKEIPRHSVDLVNHQGFDVEIEVPAVPGYRAAILVASIDGKPVKEANAKRPFEVIPYMFAESKLDVGSQLSVGLRQQRESYEILTGNLMRKELRSEYAPSYRYEMRHWIRSSLVVHDLQLEEARQLRCAWYHEHTLWGGSLDQLSFAHVMARLDLERKFGRHELDEAEKKALAVAQVSSGRITSLADVPDPQLWHEILRADETQNQLYSSGRLNALRSSTTHEEGVYVKIINMPGMNEARAKWNETRHKLAREEKAHSTTKRI